MKPCPRILTFLALVLAVSPALAQITSTAPSTQHATTRPTVPDWPRLLARLASDSFTERQAAQAELAEVSPDLLNQLEAIARNARDPELQARLLARAAQMKVYIALHPAPFSFSVKDATLSQVVAAINQSAGTRVLFPPEKTFDDKRFTLTADRLSFPDLILALNAQHPLCLDHSRTPAVIFFAKQGRYALADAFLAQGLIIQGQDLLPNGKLHTVAWHFGVYFHSDPRVHIVRMERNLHLTLATDDKGTDLTGGVEVRPTIQSPSAPGTLSALNPDGWVDGDFWLQKPAENAAAITRVKGFVRMQVAVEMQHVVVEDFEKKINQPIPLDHGTFTVSAFDPWQSRGMRAEWTGPRGASAELPTPDAPGMIVCSIFKSIGGQRIGSFVREGFGTSDATTGGRDGGPFRLEIYLPRRTHEFTVPFEFTNIPIVDPNRPE